MPCASLLHRFSEISSALCKTPSAAFLGRILVQHNIFQLVPYWKLLNNCVKELCPKVAKSSCKETLQADFSDSRSGCRTGTPPSLGSISALPTKGFKINLLSLIAIEVGLLSFPSPFAGQIRNALLAMTLAFNSAFAFHSCKFQIWKKHVRAYKQTHLSWLYRFQPSSCITSSERSCKDPASGFSATTAITAASRWTSRCIRSAFEPPKICAHEPMRQYISSVFVKVSKVAQHFRNLDKDILIYAPCGLHLFLYKFPKQQFKAPDLSIMPAATPQPRLVFMNIPCLRHYIMEIVWACAGWWKNCS